MKTVSSTRTVNTIINEKKFKSKKKSYNFNKLIKYIESHKSSKDDILLSIILPMYNEEKTIRAVLESLPIHDLIEIIVINDHSTDNSLREIKKANLGHKMRVLHHKQNKGYGGAITTGMIHAKGKVIVCMDTDGQHNAEDIFTLIKPIIEGESDITIGSRYLGAYNYQPPILRQVGELLAEKIIHLFFRLHIKNNQNGFRAYNRRSVILFKSARYFDYTFCTEQILKASIYNYKIKECPITVYGREHGTSKLIIIKLALNIFSCFLLYYFRKIKVLLDRKNQ